MEYDKMNSYIEELICELTLEEKISMVHGNHLFTTQAVDRLGIPALHFSDGPMGVRLEFKDDYWHSANRSDDFTTYLPCNSAIASTWNRDVARKMGEVLGDEARGRGKDVILAPGINIKRSPLCGRNFEYMSEDPKLVEELVVPMVQGVQESDVAACVKHFAANSQETERLWVDTIVDERTLNEIYFPGFYAATKKGKAYSIMGAYNLLNGEHCCTSKSLLNRVLRQKWGYDGTVISDWGGVHSTELASASALDVEMDVRADFDNYYMAEPLRQKIISGEIPEEALDEKVRNILRMMYRLKMIGPDVKERKSGHFNTREHQQAVLLAAEESIVLLKNEDKILPLDAKRYKKITVIGSNAVTVHADGGGSAELHALYEITPLMGLRMVLGGNVEISYAPGYYVPKKQREEISWQAKSTTSEDEVSLSPVDEAEESVKISEEYRKEALSLAKESDLVIYVGGLNHGYDVEGLDRNDMCLPYGQDKLIDALLDIKPDTIVVMYAGSPVEMPWLHKVKSLVWSYYAGMDGGTALAKVLFGEVNPSAKLAETFLQKIEDCPAKQGENFACKDRAEYTEGVMVGYRYYDTYDIPVNYCFGYGLSYTEYEYSNLRIIRKETGAEVTFSIANIGEIAGKEIAQIYVAPKCDCGQIRPIHELKGFEKVFLKPGESREVKVMLDSAAFSSYFTEKEDFLLVPGEYEIQVGASSRDIRLRGTITL